MTLTYPALFSESLEFTLITHISPFLQKLLRYGNNCAALTAEVTSKLPSHQEVSRVATSLNRSLLHTHIETSVKPRGLFSLQG